MFLTLFLFPTAFIGLWDDQGRLIRAMHTYVEGQGEKQLVAMWEKLKVAESLKAVVTFGGPGPFAALRMGQSFAQGVALGLGCAIKIFSIFDVLPQKIAQRTRVCIGIPGQWMSQDGEKSVSTDDQDIFFIHSKICLSRGLALGRLLAGATLEGK